MTTQTATLGLIGCGRMGREQVEAAARAGIPVAWVADADDSAAAALADELGLGRRSVLEVLDQPDVDGVVVAVPPGVMREGIEALVESGTGVLTEKPIAVSLPDAQRLAAIEAKHPSVPCAVGYMNRFRPAFIRARARAAAGQHPHLATLRWVGGRYKKAWWTVPDLSGGPFNEQAGHLVDIVGFAMGDIQSVQCVHTRNVPLEEAESVSLLLETAHAIASLTWSCTGLEKSIAVNLYGSDWSAEANGWEFVEAGAADAPVDVFAQQIHEFARRLGSPSDPSPLCTFAEGAAVSAVMQAAAVSSLEGRKVDVEN